MALSAFSCFLCLFAKDKLLFNQQTFPLFVQRTPPPDPSSHHKKTRNRPACFSLVTETTATQKGEGKALHTEKAAWTSKRSRGALRTRHKNIIEHQEKPQWLDGEIKLRNKPLAVEERRVRKAADLKKPGAAKAGEPPGESDVELEKHEPKPKPQPKPWGPMNRKVHEEHPRGHLGVFEGDFGGCEDKDRKAGVMACFMNPTKTRKNKHYWCVCDRAQDGNWVMWWNCCGTTIPPQGGGV